MLIKTFAFSCLLLTSLAGRTQTFEKTSSGIKTNIDSTAIELKFYGPSVIRVIKAPSRYKYQKESFTVIKSPDKVRFQVKTEGNSVILISDALRVNLDLKSGKLQYLTLDKKLLLAEKEESMKFRPLNDMGKHTFEIEQSFSINGNEAIYGLGQQQNGMMNYRNTSVLLQQKNRYIGIPFIQTSAGYGVYWDNYSATTFKDQGGTTTFKSTVGDGIDYYFMNGGNADKVIAQMRNLSGKAPMFPRWVFGFWQSRERYESQAELIGVIKKYRTLKVPLDGIVQDWQYWGDTRPVWNSTEFGNPKFPQPKLMLDSVHLLNAHMIISVWPSFGNKTAIYKELKDSGYLYSFKTWPEEPSVQVYDAFNPAARAIYWKYINKNLFSIGMDGWWLDATEPEQDTRQSNLAKTFKGSFKSVRNAFPLLTTTGVYEHQRKVTSDKRVFILTRSAFAGQQRNATMTWSGDTEGSWDTFRKQIPGGLNLSLTGIPYWNTDIGGFTINAQYPKGIKDLAFHELYTRWLQFATFTPMLRSHGTNTPREIYQFGKKGDWAYDAQEKFINLRYRLLPYIYSQAWQITNNSSTMMRALVMDFAADHKVYNIDNEYLFGKSILVTPVTDSLYVSRASGAAVADFNTVKTKTVYLPAGTEWINFWTGEKHLGGHSISCKAPIDEIPLFIKVGSILPFGPFQQYSSEKKTAPIELRIYPGANGRFVLYEDENDNYNYEKGVFSTIVMNWDDGKKILTLQDRKGKFPEMLTNRTFNIIVVDRNAGTGVNTPAKFSKVIQYTGKRVQVKLIN